ncbi:biotin/lipoyl-binding protein [Pseudemcibacter aquimaris]|uniref:biotin/lipoyl-binding protein n=1 Tax=Pseudemcibacter aquimaris TaxID=2857064 RepID=UPI0020112C86|nr:biotin/lipoyl-binding protein [Pseudemcibacter aquimaris]MCC3860328.1 biotin/lipoyl-binding protein [Pseudemcibacter aquimaris]WDU57654.1 biotin/lipoyl-binding protein [Pseudemcibacter aquimaris]
MTEENKNENEENTEENAIEETAEQSTAVAASSGNPVQKGVNSFLGKNTNKPTEYYAKFLSRATLLEESGPPASSVSTIRVIGLIVIGCILASPFISLNETSVAQGEVVPSISVQPVQHLEGGIVNEVFVKDGDVIKKGEPLMQLDDTSTLAELNRARTRYVSLDMQMRRLRDFALNERADFSDYEDEYPVIALDQEKLLNQQK